MGWFHNLPRPLQYCIIFGTACVCATSAVFVYQFYTGYQRKREYIFVDDICTEKSDDLSAGKFDDILADESDDSFIEFSENMAATKEIESNVTNELESDDEFEKISNKTSSKRSSKVAVENISMDDGFSEQKTARKIVLLGLANSGKSALLAQLSKEGIHHMEYAPTKGFNVVCISFDTCDLSIWEIGGGEDYRLYWRNFCDTTNLILFVIDSSDRDKFKSAKKYFLEIIESLHGTVDLQIVATKSDKEESASLEELYTALGLEKTSQDILRVAVVTGGAVENIGIEQLQHLCLADS